MIYRLDKGNPSGCGSGGRVLASGARGRGFESRHSDQRKNSFNDAYRGVAQVARVLA